MPKKFVDIGPIFVGPMRVLIAASERASVFARYSLNKNQTHSPARVQSSTRINKWARASLVTYLG